MELRADPACDSTCRPNGVSAETLTAMRSVTAATVKTRPSRSGRRWRPVAPERSPAPAGRARARGTVCSQAETESRPPRACPATQGRAAISQAETESRPPRACLATQAHAAISQATGSGCGVARRARIRSRPSPAGSTESTAPCSAPRRKSS
jgi:hypothetical protein